MSDKKRFLKIFVALIALLSVVIYAVFMFANLHHDCPGEGCEICAVIAVCRSILKSLFIAFLLISLSIFAYSREIHIFVGKKILKKSNSLVSMSVKLTN